MLCPNFIALLGFIQIISHDETLYIEIPNPSSDSNSKCTIFVKDEKQEPEGQMISTYQVSGVIGCALRCARHFACFSFNIETEEDLDKGASILCELFSTVKLHQTPRRSRGFYQYRIYVSVNTLSSPSLQ